MKNQSQMLITLLLVVLINSILSIKLRRKLKIHKTKRVKDDEHQLIEIDLPKPKKEYRKFYSTKLDNGLEVLIINDMKSEYSQAGLAVNVGAMMDPINLQGMAHFTEHMLFQGSEKYNQSESYFFQKVAEYGGGSNAYTSPFITNYFFSVQDKGLNEVLDIWSQFFISPKFDEKSILKELNAVNSEYEMKVNTQGRTQLNAFKMLIQKKHPMSKFTVGNFKSLLEEPLDDDVSLIKEMKLFFNQYYSSNIMKLCIITKQDPFEVYSNIKTTFGKVKNHNVQKEQLYYNSIKLFRNKSFMIKYKAKKEVKQFNIYFEIDYDYFINYGKKSIDYITQVFDNNGVHSFRKYLIDNDWVYSLNCNLDSQFDHSVAIGFQFSLTDKGYNNIESFVELFFEYVDQLQQTEPDVNYYNYLRKVAKLEFQMQDKIDSVGYFTSNMLNYDIKDILYSSFHFDGFDSHDIKKILMQINIEKAQYTLGVDHFKYSKKMTDKNKDIKHRYLSQKHKYHELPYEMIKHPFQRQSHHDNHSNFSISYNDKYIPDDIQIEEKQNQQDSDKGDQIITEIPIIIEQNNGKKIWYFDYQHEKQPYQIVIANVYSDICYQNITQKNLNLMLQNYMSKVYSDIFFDISNIESIYQISFESILSGIKIYFKAPQGYCKTVIWDVLTQIMNNEFSESQFELFKQKMYLSMQNNKFATAGQQIIEKFKYFYYKDYQLNLFKKQKLKLISYQQFMNYKSEFIKNVFVEGFCSGNISKEECSQIFKMVENRSHKINILEQKVIKIENHKEIVFKNSIKTDNNHAIYYLIQNGLKTTQNMMIMRIFRKTLKQMLFDYLRTQKQLGYMVSGQVIVDCDVLGYTVNIVGVNTDVDNYEQEIKNAISIIMEYFNKLEQDEFDKLKQGLIKDLKIQVQDLTQLVDYFWQTIDNRKYEFKQINENIQQTRNIELERVKQLMNELFMQNNVFVLKLKTQSEFNDKDRSIQKTQLQDLRQKVYY